MGRRNGAGPYAGVTIGPDGDLYGTTIDRRGQRCKWHGIQLSPPASVCRRSLCLGRKPFCIALAEEATGLVLCFPWVFGSGGNLYGTTELGGGAVAVRAKAAVSSSADTIRIWLGGNGALCLLGPAPWNLPGVAWCSIRLATYMARPVRRRRDPLSICSRRVWHGFPTDTLRFRMDRDCSLHFSWGRRVSSPGGLVFDSLGDLYGTTAYGFAGDGAVFELTPSGGQWTYIPLYSLMSGPSGGCTVHRKGGANQFAQRRASWPIRRLLPERPKPQPSPA